MKNYIKKNNADILKSVDSFCNYYSNIRKYIDAGTIKSSLDRGAFSHPSQILNSEIINLLGVGKRSNAIAYGPESGDYFLRKKIAEIENLKHKTAYNKENVAIVAGAWCGVEIILEEIAKLKDGKTKKTKIAIIGPTHYQLFHRAINKLGIEFTGFDFTKSFEKSVPVFYEEIEEMFKIKPNAIFITNPNNPNGEYFSSKILKRLVEECEKRKIYLIIDEIQDFLTVDDISGLDYGSWIQSPMVVRVDSFSKKRGLAEYRVGWVIGNANFLGNRLKGVTGRLSGLMGNAPRAANTAIIKLLELEKEKIENGNDPLEKYWEKLKKKETYILKELKKDKRIKIMKREACLNITIKVDLTSINDINFSIKLMENGTLIMPCSGYGYNPEDLVLRITFAERFEKIKHAIKILNNTIKNS